MPEVRDSHRHSFGRPYLRAHPWKSYTAEGVPLLSEEQDWHTELAVAVPWLWNADRTSVALPAGAPVALSPCNLEWMPVARYRHLWPQMTAELPAGAGAARVGIPCKGAVPSHCGSIHRNREYPRIAPAGVSPACRPAAGGFTPASGGQTCFLRTSIRLEKLLA